MTVVLTQAFIPVSPQHVNNGLCSVRMPTMSFGQRSCQLHYNLTGPPSYMRSIIDPSVIPWYLMALRFWTWRRFCHTLVQRDGVDSLWDASGDRDKETAGWNEGNGIYRTGMGPGKVVGGRITPKVQKLCFQAILSSSADLEFTLHPRYHGTQNTHYTFLPQTFLYSGNIFSRESETICLKRASFLT